jgi:hypothetical protein
MTAVVKQFSNAMVGQNHRDEARTDQNLFHEHDLSPRHWRAWRLAASTTSTDGRRFPNSIDLDRVYRRWLSFVRLHPGKSLARPYGGLSRPPARQRGVVDTWPMGPVSGGSIL